MALTSGRPDSDLIAGSRTEPAMFSEIFDRRHRELYRYLRSRVGAGLAADLAADTFVTAFARRDAYRPQSPDARPWLHGIAHNLLRNHRRHERRLAWGAACGHGLDDRRRGAAGVAPSPGNVPPGVVLTCDWPDGATGWHLLRRPRRCP
jgi:DNA-directed RNA polymerase specialized sigma24 family protein